MERRSSVPDWHATRQRLIALGFGAPEALAEIGADAGAYSPAGRWVVRFADGSRAFVKSMVARPLPAHGLRREHAVYASAASNAVPELLGWFSADPGSGFDVLVVEDLATATWGTPIRDDDARSLRDALLQLANTPPPAGLRAIPAEGAWPGTGWRSLTAHLDTLGQVGVLDDGWFADHVELLAAAEATVTLAGDGLVHGDLWLQNWCRAPRGAVIVDWTGAASGNPDVNLAWGECGVRAAAGPTGIVLPASHPDHAAWAAWMSGITLGFLAQDHQWRDELPRLHATQLREALAGLAWACQALGIPEPDNAATRTAAGSWEP